MPELPDIICAGMITADVLVEGFAGIPPTGQTGGVTRVSMAPGGDAMNQATALTKLGHPAALMGLVGDDAQGDFVLGACRERGIDTSTISVAKGTATSTAIVLIEAGGERSFLAPAESTLKVLGPEHMDLSAIRPGLKVLSIGSLFWARRFDLGAVAPLLRRAKEVGAITLADMTMDQRDYGFDGLADAWTHLDYAVPSELEGALFTGSADPAHIARDLRGRGVRNVIVKRGPKGVVGFFGDTVIARPAFDIVPVDTTGAGDNFVAGFIHGLVSNIAVEDALTVGSATAALSIQATGAGAGLKDRAQVERFLSVHRA